MSTIRVLLADDHALVRAGIRRLLEHISGVEVVGEADDGAMAVQLAGECQPDLVLMDVGMPRLSGIEATAQIKAQWPQVRVIILSMYVDEDYVLRALRAGAVGYLMKSARTTELELAISAVANGESYLSPAASQCLIEDTLQRSGHANAPERLSARQREVLNLIVQGYSRRQIAEKIKLSAKTVDTYRAQIMEQLGIHDVAGLVRYAVTSGLVDKP